MSLDVTMVTDVDPLIDNFFSSTIDPVNTLR